MQHTIKNGSHSPLLMNMLSTTISWLINEDELYKAVEEHLAEIRELNSRSDAELRALGITRDQITAYVLNENA